MYPIETPSGVAYAPPVTDYDARNECVNCKHLRQCEIVVYQQDGLALCEQVLDWERTWPLTQTEVVSKERRKGW